MEGSPYSSYTPLPNVEPPKRAPSHMRLWVTLIALGVIGISASFFMNRVPANAVAIVNGEIVTKEDVEKRVAQIVAAYGAQGVVVEDQDLLAELHTQALQTAIADTLLLQEANRIGVAIMPEEIDARFNEFMNAGQNSEAMLSEYGLLPDDIKRHIGIQIAIEKLVTNYTKLHGVSAPESEMQDLYKQIVKDETATSSFEAMQSDLRSRVLKQKTDKLMIEYLENLRKKAEIKIYQ